MTYIHDRNFLEIVKDICHVNERHDLPNFESLILESGLINGGGVLV